jgi:hypothetical protein
MRQLIIPKQEVSGRAQEVYDLIKARIRAIWPDATIHETMHTCGMLYDILLTERVVTRTNRNQVHAECGLGQPYRSAR